MEAYVRVGNESVKATANYAFSKLKERYKKWTGNSFDDKDLISFGLVNEQGDLTNVGALLADESPIRCSRLFCTRWNGLNKSGGAVDALDDAEYSGSVISLIENGEAFIKRNCKMKWRKTANSREEMPEYVERSYHEALVNALAHRDYLVNGSEAIGDEELEKLIQLMQRADESFLYYATHYIDKCNIELLKTDVEKRKDKLRNIAKRIVKKPQEINNTDSISKLFLQCEECGEVTEIDNLEK